MNSAQAIALERVTKVVGEGPGERMILSKVDLEVARGEFLAVMGPSGSGKTTLLGLIAGLDRPSSGLVRLLDHDLVDLGEDAVGALRSRVIGFVFQEFHLIPTLTARENVQVPLELAGEYRKAGARSMELLERMGIGALAGSYPTQMSGGEQQRVAIARALARDPPVLLADEPTGNLDRESGEIVMALLEQVHREHGATIVMVTHNPRLAGRCQRTIAMADGQLVDP